MARRLREVFEDSLSWLWVNSRMPGTPRSITTSAFVQLLCAPISSPRDETKQIAEGPTPEERRESSGEGMARPDGQMWTDRLISR